MPPSTALPIYRIEPFPALERIVRGGRILCYNEVTAQQAEAVSVGHRRIKEERRRKPIPLASGGVVADYVPFYFCPRPPMLLKIATGQVDDGDPIPEREMIHLVCDARHIAQVATVCLSDGNAASATTRFFDDLDEGHQSIDWTAVQAKYWNNTEEHPDRMRRKQAEFLIHRQLPWNYVKLIGVRDSDMHTQVVELLQVLSPAHVPRVKVEPSWYYR